MQLRELVSLSATLTTIGVFCTGIPVCRKIIRNGDTHETSFFPLMVMFISSVLWMKYGLLRVDVALVFVNSLGAFLGLLYVLVYYAYTCHRKLLYRQLAIGACIVYPPLIYIKFYAQNHDEALLHLGYTCAAVSILSYGSPLSAVVEVLKSGSTACMAFPMSLGNFLASAQWYTYGCLLKDKFVQIPNALGIALGIVQLGLFWKFRRRNT